MGVTRSVLAWSVGVLVAAGAVVAGVFLSAPDPADGTARNAATVFCLSSEHRTQLTEAAAHLNVTIPADGFRGTESGFNRVCDALVGATRITQQAPSASANSGKSTFGVLLTVIVGAALTWLTGFWRDERTQSRMLADELRNATRKYLRAVGAQREKWLDGRQGKLPVDQAVLEGRDELAALLHKIAVQRPGWRVPSRLRDQLSSTRLGEAMNDPRPGESPAQRGEALQGELNVLLGSINEVVSALERPWRWHGEMRRTLPAATQATSIG